MSPNLITSRCVDVLTSGCREDLREQNALSEEIVNAITTGQTDAIDDVDLEDELEQMQQEQLDEQMISTGSVPVSDAVHRMPAPANGERKNPPSSTPGLDPMTNHSRAVKGKTPVAVEEDDEEAELRKLQAEMAM